MDGRSRAPTRQIITQIFWIKSESTHVCLSGNLSFIAQICDTLRFMPWVQRLYRTQIIWVCSDIWVFSVLDNRLLADNLSQLPKVSIWLRKVGYVVNTCFFGLLFYSDLTQTNEIWLRTSTHFCREVGYVVNTRFFGLLFYSDLTQTNEIRLRYDSDIWVKKWRVKPLLEWVVGSNIEV